LRTDERLLNFSELRLASAEDSRRGELVWVGLAERYSETVSYDRRLIVEAIGLRDGCADTVLGQPLPGNYEEPRDQDGFDYVYSAPGTVDVPADGQFHSVPLDSFELKPGLHFVTVPRESTNVFRTAEFCNQEDMALLGGPADVFVGSDFLHTTPIKSVLPGGTFRLGLGVSESIKLTRQTRYKENTKGLMGGTTRLPHTVELEARSYLSHPITLEVRERLPHPGKDCESEVKVEIDEVSPKWEPYQPEETPDLKTAYRWFLKLDPGEAVKAAVTYSISLPSKYELVGGNRREAST
jgi:uncharacterized protein (TIGR02231 family)